MNLDWAKSDKAILAAKHINPYQGLKQGNYRELQELAERRKTHKSLSGIETLQQIYNSL